MPWRASQPSTQPQELLEATRHVAGGNLAYRVEVNRNDELGMLARSFNHMTDTLA